MSLRKRLSTYIVEYRSLLVFVVSMLLFRSAFADWTYVPSGSMNPTIVEGDRVLVDKMAYGLRVPFTTMLLTHGSDPQRGDIVIFASPKDGITLIKRVIGLPGDRIEMREEQLLVNGVATNYSPALDIADADLPRVTRAQNHDYLTEHLANRPHAIMVLPQRMAMRSFGPIQVPTGEYLMLGDSRDNSEDSRYIGLVPRESIVGRAFSVAYSLNADRWYLPRTDRLVTPLR